MILAFGLALAGAFAATPVAISVAGRLDFHDLPKGYKAHRRPTPYLGGAAVLTGFLLAALVFGQSFAHLTPIVLCTVALWALGTLDDRVGLPAGPRVVAEAVAALVLWATGLGWDVFAGDAADMALTVLWVVGVVNAFNLMDNMDGAAAAVAGVTAAAIGTLAVVEGDTALAALVFGLTGACFGFLPYNLSRPSRIFLGDGGSLTIGFVVAATVMALPLDGDLGLEKVLVGVLLAGVPVVDTALVTISRRRAGLSVLTGGRDHLTHRLSSRLGTPRAVALSLAVVQAGVGLVAVGVVQLGRGSVLVAWLLWFVCAAGAVVLLETSAWAPARGGGGTPKGGGGAPARRGASQVEVVLIAFIAVSCGLSPFLYGFYDLSVWGPIGLVLLAALLGLVIARPASPRRVAVAAMAGLTGLWLWSLLSIGWAESADAAAVEANRWLLYATLFAVLVFIVRDNRLATVVLAAATAVIVLFGLYIGVRLVTGSGSELFLAARLNEPLGYINGQAGYLLLGIWPLVAVAEQARHPLARAAALAGATYLAGIVLLAQTRAVVPALLVAALVLVLAVPGRTRRAWALAFVGLGVAACLGPVLEVFDSVRGLERPDDDVLRSAGLTVTGAALAAGALWAVATVAVERLGARRAAARRASQAVLALLVAGGLVAGLVAVDDPAGQVRTEYRAFVELQVQDRDKSRFATGGGNRYDYWRIAVDQFADRPVTGLGAGNYDRTYFAERRTTEDIRQPHSIELQTLGELGLVGGLLLALFLVAVLVGFVRRALAARTDSRSVGLVVAAGGMFILWLVHTSVDWLHLIPGVTGIALCAAAVLVGPWRSSRATLGSARTAALTVGCALLILLGAVFLGRMALADRELSEGREALAAGEPAEALAKAGSSLEYNDEPLAAYYLESAAWARLGRYRPARAALLEATRREPSDFVTWALLGDLATRRQDRGAALTYYRRASALNPRDRSLRAAVRRAERRARG